ncbi:hypothetical protein H310_00342 [Aphanomyces invadans]|uniref:CAAX prenyl protease n=1 Tax=Aphanomyces invadans TaxID=157072 RepID=A0A024UWA9_9STRA|nr:hypothetical protein H310_00342 [Aphanomyces invadans]ETW09903.1 hypothetical protein H310_00342 [Aphanomyces invadans]|eukprot:XP_008861314.1 hypothetical protein H310_00342 [Aphanomyces invadans]
MLKTWFQEEGWRASAVPYLEGTILFICVMHVFETYLDIRQHRKLYETTLPDKLSRAIRHVDEQNIDKKHGGVQGKGHEVASLLEQTTAKFDKCRLYSLDKSRFKFVHDTFQVADGLAMLVLGYMPFMWQYCRALLASFGYTPTNEIMVSLTFVILTGARDVVLSIPFDLYSTFVVEERHGFNKQTLGLFVADKIKGTLLSVIIGFPVVSALIWIIRWGGDNFVVYVWIFTFTFTLIMMTIVPVWIMPLFNKFTPLECGPLRDAIEALAASVSFPLTKLFVCDGSKRSGHSNAYLFGFFNNKRIVLYDTLLEQATQDEVVAILGHELGHWKKWHTVQNLIVQQLYILAMFSVFGRCMHDRDLFASFGFNSHQHDLPVMIGLTLFTTTLWAPVDKVLQYLLTANTRAKEFEADAFAVDLGYGDPLQSALTKISLENLTNMNPDALYSAYHYSHPPLVERLGAIAGRMQAKSKRE